MLLKEFIEIVIELLQLNKSVPALFNPSRSNVNITSLEKKQQTATGQ